MKLGKALGGKLIKAKEKKVDKLWSIVKDSYDLGIQLRRPFERRWLISLAFLAGRQYVFFNQNAHILQQLRRSRGKLRKVDNQLIRRWGRQVSDMVSTVPIMSVVPNTNEDADIKAAKVGDKVLKAFWRNNKMRKKVRLMAGWIYSVGNCFLDDRWDPRLGPTEVDEESGEVVYSGDADCGVWSPFEVLVPFTTMGETDLHTFPWIIKVKFRTLDWIKKYHPKKGGEVKAEDIPFPYSDLTSLMGQFGGEGPTKVPGAMLINFYMQPNADYPKGLFVAAANGVVLEHGDWPIDYYHLEHFKDIDIPGIFWGKATLEEGVSLQKSWNRVQSSIGEFNRVLAKGKGLVPRGAKLDTLPNNEHGEWLEYTPVLGHKPDMLNQKGLPQTLLWEMEWTRRSLDDLYHQHEVSQGTTRSDLRSGEMARFLREQDARGAIPTHAIFEESLEAVMGRVLKRVQSGYATERMLKIRGDEGEYEIFSFKGADLRNNTDVSVKRDSTLPDSRLAREAMIMERFGQGLYGDPRDPETRRRVLQMLDDANTKDVFNEMRLDEVYARWESETFRRSEGVDMYLVNEYDDHGVHIREHNKFRKSMEFQRLKVENPEAFMELERILTEHVGMHQRFLAEQQAKQMEAQANYERMVKGKEVE